MIDINKKYKTRDGREVIIHAINLRVERYPVIASVLTKCGWQYRSFSSNGEFVVNETSQSDLIEVVPLWEGEIWVHENGVICKCDPEGDEESWIEKGWRKVKAREVEP